MKMTATATRTRKEIVSILDVCAARSNKIGATPATSKQCWFLAGLLEKDGDEATVSSIVTDSTFILSKREASQMIEHYIERTKS